MVLIYELTQIRGRGPRILWPLHEQFVPHDSASIQGLAFAGAGHDMLVAVSDEGELSGSDADSASVDIRLSLPGPKPNCLAGNARIEHVGKYQSCMVSK